MNTIGAYVYVGPATNPNKVTGADIFIRWEAALVPLRECEGNGWYTRSFTEIGWSFRSKAVHKGWFGSVLDDSTWNTRSLEDLVENAIRAAHTRYCPSKVCSCGKGYRSAYDGKCGHCRNRRERDPRYSWLTEDEFLSELKRGRNPMERTLLDFNGKEMAPGKWVKFMRTEVGKGSNFNYWYSGALSTIAERLGWDSDTHWAAVDRYRERFAVAEQWRTNLIAEGARNGFITLPDGHRRVRIEATDAWFIAMRRKFADILADPAVIAFADLALPKIQTRAKNQLVNSKIQGSCATLAKRSILNIRKAVDMDGVRFVNQFTDAEKRTAMNLVRAQRRNQGLARFMLPIHDELLFSVHRDYVADFIPLLRKGMCEHPDIIRTLPLHCNVAVGRTFKPYDDARPAFSQIEFDEAPVIEGVIGEEWEGKALPEEMYPKIIDWMMAA